MHDIENELISFLAGQRLAKAKERRADFETRSDSGSSSESSSLSTSYSPQSSAACSELSIPTPDCPSPAKFPTNNTAYCLVPSLCDSEAKINQIPISVYTALFNNGKMLGLTCGFVIPSKSSPCEAHIPEALHPTPLQLTTLHQLWIDRFPFPKMRDNMISLNRIFHEEDFLEDLFNMQSFEIRPGGKCWDPSAWKMGKIFGQKWGYLFY